MGTLKFWVGTAKKVGGDPYPKKSKIGLGLGGGETRKKIFLVGTKKRGDPPVPTPWKTLKGFTF